VVTKPLPVLALGTALLLRRPTGYGRWIAAGLGLSAVGDVLLERPGGFLPGLAAFLLAHVTYAAAFASEARRPRLLRALPFLAWLGTAGGWLWPTLGPLRVPVVIYMLAIGTMMWRAAARVGHDGRPTVGEWVALAGAVLFGVSDTLIAIDRFRGPLAGAPVPVMTLYWAGQAGIAASVLGREGRRA
jgi:uncharacterized membrane protein YhhN